MGVPDTTTFDLQDVVDEINPTTDDLADCFSDAVASKFDSSYEGSKNQLLNFRNYGAVTQTPFLTGPGQADAKFICDQTVDRTRYHDGSGTNPSVGDTVRNTSGGSVTGDGFYSLGTEIPQATSGFYRITGGSGVVNSTAPCNP